MRGYATMSQFVQDYQLLGVAKKVDPGREGETVTSYMKKMINARLAKAALSFKNSLARQKYSLDDLKLIATHDSLSNVHTVEFFVKECFGTNYVGPQHYKRLLRSVAFKSGRLKRLYEFIPTRIETKNDFIRFIKTRRGISKPELTVIMKSICKKEWQMWLNELIHGNKIMQDRGRWLM